MVRSIGFASRHVDQHATGGDTILVAPGTYIENVVINGKAINIEGFGAAHGVGGAVLDGSITETGALNGNMTIDGLVINALGQQNGISLTPTLGGSETVTVSNVSVCCKRVKFLAWAR